jgi:hypothetical protein
VRQCKQHEQEQHGRQAWPRGIRVVITQMIRDLIVILVTISAHYIELGGEVVARLVRQSQQQAREKHGRQACSRGIK